jgi:hypothetical protein
MVRPPAPPVTAESVEWARRNGLVRVRLEGDRHLELEWGMLPSGDFGLLCFAPCDLWVPLDRRYMVVGPDMPDSRRFDLSASPGQTVALQVSPGSWRQRNVGIVLVALGGLSLATGLVGFVLDSLVFRQAEEALPDQAGLFWGSLAFLAGGGAILAGGLAATLSNTHSGVTQSASPVPESSLQTASVRGLDAAALRLPTWSARDAEVVRPRATGVPIFTYSF